MDMTVGHRKLKSQTTKGPEGSALDRSSCILPVALPSPMTEEMPMTAPSEEISHRMNILTTLHRRR